MPPHTMVVAVREEHALATRPRRAVKGDGANAEAAATPDTRRIVLSILVQCKPLECPGNRPPFAPTPAIVRVPPSPSPPARASPRGAVRRRTVSEARPGFPPTDFRNSGYANVRRLRRPGPWPGAEAVTVTGNLSPPSSRHKLPSARLHPCGGVDQCGHIPILDSDCENNRRPSQLSFFRARQLEWQFCPSCCALSDSDFSGVSFQYPPTPGSSRVFRKMLPVSAPGPRQLPGDSDSEPRRPAPVRSPGVGAADPIRCRPANSLRRTPAGRGSACPRSGVLRTAVRRRSRRTQAASRSRRTQAASRSR